MLASVMFDLRPIGGDRRALRRPAGRDAGSWPRELDLRGPHGGELAQAHAAARASCAASPRSARASTATDARPQDERRGAGRRPRRASTRCMGRLTAVNTRARLEAARAAGIDQPARRARPARRLRPDRRDPARTPGRRRSAPASAPDNFMPPAELSDFERSHLRDAFVVVRRCSRPAGQGSAGSAHARTATGRRTDVFRAHRHAHGRPRGGGPLLLRATGCGAASCRAGSCPRRRARAMIAATISSEYAWYGRISATTARQLRDRADGRRAAPPGGPGPTSCPTSPLRGGRPGPIGRTSGPRPAHGRPLLLRPLGAAPASVPVLSTARARGVPTSSRLALRRRTGRSRAPTGSPARARRPASRRRLRRGLMRLGRGLRLRVFSPSPPWGSAASA